MSLLWRSIFRVKRLKPLEPLEQPFRAIRTNNNKHNTHSQSANVQKIFRDGQLVIIRDGKTYNAQGVEL